ncbi:enoyl-CoA hydratase/isomerase family protein [Simplicispira metamorpha]|jgi:methylglutaconyl-CoA hydratase|uniref:Methylglutaconyl-CoA hydratase n=1 Tax=Simplicispira metamorpha TaxID=80881 RepID=A0A4R2N6J1_9BURK|nr:enoyl-CoA hydratase/isomerase family protein [Simplicispira metamorpha]MBP7412468.1 enoyl-CoA hydratase/isomerase family protein [Giesbergeria sp.]TCP16438.1 methylglutaconyl-CoA hydratase [Simplicispira metamorpha]
MYSTLSIERQDRVATIWMDRPDVFNAFDEQLIADLGAACAELDADASVRVVVLAGRGKHFSAGADLNWMKRASVFTEEENRADARKFAHMLRALSDMSKPTVARVQGAALGGGTGLAAACDMAVASVDAQFATSEVKFGIIPAVISPYVLRAIGPRHALRYFQSGERFSAQRALAMGLVTEVCERDQLDATIAQLVGLLMSGAPLAQQSAKHLIAAVDGCPIDAAISEETAQRIARQRATSEAKDGISAFLEKRTPAWLV